ncbi:PDE1 [Candida pseudojiufengensis]|uniref:PDE1 n=1 Tax=Candida pseudojiufengensis TaxID=497109 RepID=UPI002224BF8F|nr:PDE1 [Candida pseudojiufengensis]KAI5958732.1 PDE1 [Candida pseudojiufengensis]
MSFEVTFLGTSGGPLEGNTCSILLKSTSIEYSTLLEVDDHKPTELKENDEILVIDAGSGMGKLTDIIYQESKNKKSICNLLDYYYDSEPIHYYYHSSINLKRPFENFNKFNTISYTKLIFNKLNNFLISHPHLDHVSSLVINSAGFPTNNPPKQVYGSKYTINSLQNHYFNGIVWPNMPNFDILNLNSVEFEKSFKIGNYEIEMFPLSHGELNMIESKKQKNNPSDGGKRHSSITTIPAGINDENYIKTKIENDFTHSNSGNLEDPTQSHYQSSAFLINRNNSSILIFGDFESDLISKLQYNQKIWHKIAPLILKNQLKLIILECSNSFEIDENKLYGHLTPKYVIYELKQLEKEILKISDSTTKEQLQQPLRGLNIMINHIKEPLLTNTRQIKDPRKQILLELNKLNTEEKLGVFFSIALSGTTIVV